MADQAAAVRGDLHHRQALQGAEQVRVAVAEGLHQRTQRPAARFGHAVGVLRQRTKHACR